MKKKFILFVSLFLCMALSFNSVSFALATSDDSIFVDELKINPRHGIVQGEFAQLTAILNPEDVSSRMVEWSSSNENIISCTKEGRITGVAANGYADITCKAKFGKGTDTIRIYCAESIGGYYKDSLKDLFVPIYNQPGTSLSSTLYFNMSFIYEFIFSFIKKAMGEFFPLLYAASVDNDISFGPCEVRGRYGKYAYVAFKTNSGVSDGFVKFTKLKNGSGNFLSLSAKDIDVWANNYTYPDCKLTTTYKGAINWSVGDKSVISFDNKTGQIIGLKPGRTTITATAGEMSLTCTVHALYRWPQQWTGKANQDTHLYKAKGAGYEKGMEITKGKNFVVWGEDGLIEGWVYGNVEGTNDWGYIPISHISNKGTILQYNYTTTTLSGGQETLWIWPVKDVKDGISQTTKARYISSPYGWRDDDPIRHKGIDITNGLSQQYYPKDCIDGYEVVSAFAGKVIFVHDISTGYKSCGNCVAVRSNEKDPITGKYFVAIYMHLKSKPSVRENQNISANTLLGYVGSTGNSGGAHLHFEVNNQNLSYNQEINYDYDPDKKMIFGSVINPLFFYMDYYNLPDNNPYKIVINPDCAAMKYRKPFWYGDDIKESKKP